MKNITLSADDGLVARARQYAQRHGTTLNQLIRDYLEQIASKRDPDSVADEFLHIALKTPGRSSEGWRFNREEVHRRGEPS